MTENNLDNIFGEEPAAAAAGGGEEMTLDGDLASMLGDSPAAEGGADAGTAGAGGEESAGGGLDLGGLMGGDEPAAAPSAAPSPAKKGVAMPVSEADVGSTAGAMADGLAHSKQTLSRREAVNLDFLLDVKLDVTFEVGRSKMMISDLLTLGQGSVVELHRLVGEELDLLVNGKLIAKGEVVVVNEKFGCKITMIVSPEERIKHLGGV